MIAAVAASGEAVKEAAEVVEESYYHLQQTDVDSVFTLLSGVVTVEAFSLITQLLTIGVLLVVVFVITTRRV